MVKITSTIQRRMDGEVRLLEKMYATWEVGETAEWMGIRKAVEMFEEPEGMIANALIVLDDLGILKRELTYPGFQKQKSDWTLLIPKHEAMQRLTEWHREVAMSPTYLKYPKHKTQTRAPKEEATAPEERVAVAAKPASEGQELVAVAGPDAESPFAALRALRKDESKALVAAARQYADKGKFLEAKIAELRSEGFEIAEGALSLKRDERLEQIAYTLPYIDALERENERLLSQVNGSRGAIRELEDLRRNYHRLKESHDRMLAERVGSRERASVS